MSFGGREVKELRADDEETVKLQTFKLRSGSDWDIRHRPQLVRSSHSPASECFTNSGVGIRRSVW